jgi:pimeloyl-ACP methyl ester carboxylesterase
MRLHYQVQGQGSRLIILHGFLGSLDNWHTASKRLSESFKVYSLDLRNHGQSPHNELMSYPIMAEDLLEFLDEENLAEANLLGHSMGGKVAMQFATEHAERVSKLIVVDIAPKAYPPFQQPLLDALRKIDLKKFKSFGEIDAMLAPEVHDDTTRRFLMKNLAREPTIGFRWKIDLDAIINNYDELTRSISTKNKFNKPTCFIRAGRSKYIQDEDVAEIVEIFPQAQIVSIPKAGHWVHIDAPEEFLQIVTDFLKSPKRSR